jgi:RNA polymerase sigma factor (sigma-70 family)
MSGVIQHLCRVLGDGAGLTDEALLGDYISRRDEVAFAALVRRHGPMVWGVCRRVLPNYHDAEDAFQATFLVLVRKAASISSRELLANWLYGVAHQTALKARATAAKRTGRERHVSEMPEPAVTQQDQWLDLQPLLDEELSRLPDKYRGVIVLCDLEGKTRKEVAGQLGCAEGTVASRLARARIMLAKRLTQRGVTLSGLGLAAVLAQQASAGVPNSMAASTIKAANLLAAGKAAATGAISVNVAALTEGMVKAMLFNKLKAVVAVVLVLCFLATGASTLFTNRTAAGQDEKKADAENPVKPEAKQQKEKDTFTAWGKEVGDVQAGLLLGEHRVYKVGETVTLIVRIRNIGRRDVPFNYDAEYFLKNPPLITDADGKAVKIKDMSVFGFIHKSSVAPGNEVDLCKLTLALRPITDRKKDEAWTLYGTGKFQIQYQDIPVVGEVRIGSPGMTLTTGKLDLEVKQPR